MTNEDNIVMPEMDDSAVPMDEAGELVGYATRLAAVNRSLRFTNIRGKEYAEVNQRILAFWSLFPNGRIVTKVTQDTGSRCDVEAMVYRSVLDYEPAVTGHAFEMKTGAINGTSYVENCETSAIGRALGFLGIGANTAIASAEEVLNAISQQEQAKKQPKKAKPKQAQEQPTQPRDELRDRAAAVMRAGGAGVRDSILEQLHDVFGVERIEQLSEEQRISLGSWLDTVEAAIANSTIIENN